MKITKRQLKRIIQEACGDAMAHSPSLPSSVPIKQVDVGLSDHHMDHDLDAGPCPHSTAEKLKSAGMSDTEILEWVNTVLSAVLPESSHF